MNCTICRRPTDPERDPIRHQHCADRLRTNLADIPELYALLGDVLAPGTTGERARVSGTRTAPLPVRLEPLSLRARGGIITILATWEADWRETRSMTDAERGIGERDLSGIVLWLRAHLPWAIEHHPAVQEFAAEVRDIVRQCQAAAGLLPNMMRIGNCPAQRAEDACGAVLLADPSAEEIRCRCGARWARSQWMLLGKAMNDGRAEAAA